MELVEFAARPVFLLARFLLWLAWDFMVLTIAWSIGWPVWRALTLGRFPHVGLGEYEHAGTGEAVLVCGAGFAVLVAVIGSLSAHFGWW
ncbi:MAG TPA: hypothetical protein VLK29_08665 [Luteimonas sp.]|nr:hypothetical protein [Luteimonas sp.]